MLARSFFPWLLLSMLAVAVCSPQAPAIQDDTDACVTAVSPPACGKPVAPKADT